MLQNVGLSLAIITVLMPLALFGVLGLAAVVLMHEVAEIFVIVNGVRRPGSPDAYVPCSSDGSGPLTSAEPRICEELRQRVLVQAQLAPRLGLGEARRSRRLSGGRGGNERRHCRAGR